MKNGIKYGFSTLGCPEWEWDDALAAASDLGFDGVELRGVGRHIYLPAAPAFSEANIPKARAALARLGLTVPCLASGALLFDRSRESEARSEAETYIKLAARLGAKYVRALADRGPAAGAVDEDCVIGNLRHLLPIAAQRGVSILIESNGVYAKTARLRELCDEIASPDLGVVWDVHHPHRFFGESAETSYNNLRPYIRHVHVKDSVMDGGIVRYRLTGKGDVPIFAAIELLASGGYDGFVCLEWVRRWDNNLEEPGLVFPHFIQEVRGQIPS
ncbi:MAG: sugar phosphate isomerase/epimerase [Clostridiales bacterium]|nr:sugar phosphate isomerase/epimerase [Clostridiales bacterium]